MSSATTPVETNPREVLAGLHEEDCGDYRELVINVAAGKVSDQDAIREKLRQLNVDHDRFVLDCSILIERKEQSEVLEAATRRQPELDAAAEAEADARESANTIRDQMMARLDEADALVRDRQREHASLRSQVSSDQQDANRQLLKTADPAIDEEIQRIHREQLGPALEAINASSSDANPQRPPVLNGFHKDLHPSGVTLESCDQVLADFPEGSPQAVQAEGLKQRILSARKLVEDKQVEIEQHNQRIAELQESKLDWRKAQLT